MSEKTTRPRPSDFLDDLLKLFPNGVRSTLILDCMEERGYSRQMAAAIVRQGLDASTFDLGDHLQIVRINEYEH